MRAMSFRFTSLTTTSCQSVQVSHQTPQMMRDYGPTLIVRVDFLQSRAALLRHWLCHECQLMRELVSCDKLHNMAFRCSLAKTLKARKMRIEPLSQKSAVSQERLVKRAYLEGGLCETEMIMVANLVSVLGRQN